MAVVLLFRAQQDVTIGKAGGRVLLKGSRGALKLAGALYPVETTFAPLVAL